MRPTPIGATGLAVREWGSGDPVVFWHALGPAASGATIGEAAPVLAERGFRVVAIDGPGFGASPALPAERYRLPSLVDACWDVVDSLGLERVTLMGHSWGGAIAVHAAAQAPDRVHAVVLLDSGHLDYGDVDEVDPNRPLADWIADARARDGRWADRETFARELRAATSRWSDALLASYLAGVHEEDGVLVGASAEARGAAFAGLAPAKQSAVWPAIAGAAIPVLLLLADQEPWRTQNASGLDRFRAALPGADVRWLENTSHAIPADLGPELGTLVADWLRASA